MQKQRQVLNRNRIDTLLSMKFCFIIIIIIFVKVGKL